MHLLKKYKPTKLDDFITDSTFKQLLNVMVNSNNLNILFCGDHSSGKTTLIDILIKQYYSTETIPIQYIFENNVFKINSLNEQGVNLFRRTIKSFCQTSSVVSHKKKFIIIDELDTLNQQNQQILRNCIDKYSKQVHFLCSCVNIQNVLDNIQSRLTIIRIPKMSISHINQVFSNIVASENIHISPEDMNTLYALSNYKITVIFNNLQKLLFISKHITTKQILDVCTSMNFNDFEAYLAYILAHNIRDATNILFSLCDRGFSVNDVLESLFDFFKLNNSLSDTIKIGIFRIIGTYIKNFYTVHEEKIELFLFTYDVIECIHE